MGENTVAKKHFSDVESREAPIDPTHLNEGNNIPCLVWGNESFWAKVNFTVNFEMNVKFTGKVYVYTR